MKRYILPSATANEHTPKHPERTARKRAGCGIMDFDVLFQVWPNRASMARSIRMQERGADFARGWKACVPLGTTEGY